MIKSGHTIAVRKLSLTACTGKERDPLTANQPGMNFVMPQTGLAGDPVTGWSVINNGHPSDIPQPGPRLLCFARK